jgi:hypothetical protein
MKNMFVESWIWKKKLMNSLQTITRVTGKIKKYLLRVGFEPTPFRTRTLIWRLRPTRPSQLEWLYFHQLVHDHYSLSVIAPDLISFIIVHLPHFSCASQIILKPCTVYEEDCMVITCRMPSALFRMVALVGLPVPVTWELALEAGFSLEDCMHQPQPVIYIQLCQYKHNPCMVAVEFESWCRKWECTDNCNVFYLCTPAVQNVSWRMDRAWTIP